MLKGVFMQNKTTSLFTVAYALFSDVLFYSLLLPLLPELRSLYNVTEFQTQLFFSLYALALILFTPLVGLLTDRLGHKPLMVGGGIGLLAATGLFLLSGDPFLLLTARFFQGASTAVNWTSGLSLISDLHEEQEKGKAMGIAMSGMSLGVLAGPILGAFLYKAIGLKGAFLIVLGLNIVDLVFRLIFIPNRKFVPSIDKRKKSIKGLVSKLVPLSVLTMLAVGLMSFLEPVLPFRLNALHGLDPMGIAWIFLTMSGINTLFYPIAGILADKTDKRILVVFGFMLSAVAYSGLILFSGLIWITVCACLLGISISILLAALLPLYSSVLERKGIGTGMIYGFFNLAYSVGMFFGPFFLSLTGGWLEFAPMVVLFIAVFMIGLFLSFIVLQEKIAVKIQPE
jgi:multidrug resistance protein